MSDHMIPMEDDGRQQQEIQEFEMWLDSLEAEKVKELDKHMQEMYKSFNKMFPKP